jgi:hypothetical protein
MTPRILLVTGSRVLEGSEFEDRAKRLLSMTLHSLPEKSIVVVGDASGPDAWATEYASGLGIALRIYALDGWVYDRHMARCRRWHLDEKTAPEPLPRNVAMVRGVAAQRPRAHVEALGLEALWGTTHGTAYTLDKARKAGLPITHITFERSKGQ